MSEKQGGRNGGISGGARSTPGTGRHRQTGRMRMSPRSAPAAPGEPWPLPVHDMCQQQPVDHPLAVEALALHLEPFQHRRAEVDRNFAFEQPGGPTVVADHAARFLRPVEAQRHEHAAALGAGDPGVEIVEIEALGAVEDGLRMAVGRVAIDHVARPGAREAFGIVAAVEPGALHPRGPGSDLGRELVGVDRAVLAERRRHVAVAAAKADHAAIGGAADVDQIGRGAVRVEPGPQIVVDRCAVARLSRLPTAAVPANEPRRIVAQHLPDADQRREAVGRLRPRRREHAEHTAGAEERFVVGAEGRREMGNDFIRVALLGADPFQQLGFPGPHRLGAVHRRPRLPAVAAFDLIAHVSALPASRHPNGRAPAPQADRVAPDSGAAHLAAAWMI